MARKLRRAATRSKAKFKPAVAPDSPEMRARVYEMFLDQVKDYGIFMVDPNNVITVWSNGVRRLFGYSRDEFIGRSGSIIFTPEDLTKKEDVKELRGAAKHGRAEDERWHIRKNGQRFWGSGIMTALRDRKGKIEGYLKVLRDATERREHEEKLRVLNETLEQRVKQRTEELVASQERLRGLVLELANA